MYLLRIRTRLATGIPIPHLCAYMRNSQCRRFLAKAVPGSTQTGTGDGAIIGVQIAASAQPAQLAPDKKQPQSDPVAQKDSKKTHRTLAEIRQDWPKAKRSNLYFRTRPINDMRRCWAPKPVRPLCQAMLTHEYAYAAVEAKSGELYSLILPHINTDCMQLFLDE